MKEKFNKQYPDRSDIARVRTFRKATGQDSASAKKEFWDTYKVVTDKWLGEDDEFKYRKITMTASGVNLNSQFKSPEEIEKLGDLQMDWTIPMVNDHPQREDPMDELFLGPRLDPNDDEISGFCVIIGAEEVDGETELHAYEAVPKFDTDALEADTYSIGYYADYEMKKGTYKGKIYDEVQKDLFIIHNARMVTQTASTPRAQAHDEDGAGNHGGDSMTEVDELKTKIADLEKAKADLETELKKVKDESKADQLKLATSSSDLKKAQDKVSELEDKVQALEADAKGFQKIQDERLETMRSLVKDNCPGKEENGSVFSDEELKAMGEDDLKKVLKATGADTSSLKFQLVHDHEEDEDEDDDEGENLSVGVPGSDGKWS